MYSTETVSVAGSPMEVFVFQPEGDGPHPGLIVCQHIPVAHAGLETDPWQLDVGERLAAQGYVVAMPFVFHWWPKEDDISVKRDGFRDDRSILDLKAAHELLKARGDVSNDRIGMIGHCWGGRVALVGACHLPGLSAAVTLYGGRTKVSMSDGATPPFELIENITCPVLGIFGNEDENPSPQDAADIAAAMAKAGVAFEMHQYDGAGHGFQDFSNPDRYREEQSEDAWGKIFAFLSRNLS